MSGGGGAGVLDEERPDRARVRACRYEEEDWTEEEFSGGCYVGVAAPRTLSHYGHMLSTPMGSVFFASTETATQCVHGARPPPSRARGH